MTRDIINVQYPTLDHTESVANIGITKTTVVQANGITIADAFSNKNNSLFIVIDSTSSASSLLTVKAGDAYPNSMLGKLAVPVEANSTTMLQIQDASRFENKDGSVNLDFSTDVAGNIYAVAKSVALNV